MIDFPLKFLKWYGLILLGVLKWRTLFFICKNWKDYFDYLSVKKTLVYSAAIGVLILIAYGLVEITK